MNKTLLGAGIFLMSLVALDLLIDLSLSELGVPSFSGFLSMIIEDMPVNGGAKNLGRRGIAGVNILEAVPWIIFIIGLVCFILGFFL